MKNPWKPWSCPGVLSLLADQAVTEEGKERARRLRPETDPAEVALRLKETTAAVNKMVLRGSPSFSGVKPVAGSLQRADMGGSLNTRELLDIAGVLAAAGRPRSTGRATGRRKAPLTSSSIPCTPTGFWRTRSPAPL